MRRQRSIFLLTAIALATGCPASKRDIETAKHSVFDAEFTVVYTAALDATRENYPNIEESAGRGVIKTLWHQVSYANNNQDDMTNARTLANAQGVNGSVQGSSAAAAGMPTRLAYKRYFIRFDVTVAGGRPWRLKVVGHAAEWEPGAALPNELHGPTRPSWLEGRTDALLYSIYKRLKDHAVPMKVEAEAAPTEPKKADPGTWKDVPPAAGKRLASIKDALASRDYAALRTQLADDVVWTAAGASGADVAMATWQADPDPLDAMAKALVAGCGGDARRVSCPPVAAPGTYQLVIEARGDSWLVTSYVKTE